MRIREGVIDARGVRILDQPHLHLAEPLTRSLVERAIGHNAIAVLGPAGCGKSTTAAAFSERGYSILAEDVVTLDDRGDQFLIRPAYPCIRLWPASVKALYGSETHLPKLTPNWEKRYLDLTERPEQFQRQPLPLKAIYQLAARSDDETAPFVEPVDRAAPITLSAECCPIP